MKRLMRKATAGFAKNGDALIEVEPGEAMEILIHSTVEKQFGDRIREVLQNELERLEFESVRVQVDDYGALDFALTARLETALRRGMEGVK